MASKNKRPSASELADYVHRTGYIRVERGRDGHFTVAVQVLDARWGYGRTDLLVEPIYGEGQVWVQLDSITFIQQ